MGCCESPVDAGVGEPDAPPEHFLEDLERFGTASQHSRSAESWHACGWRSMSRLPGGDLQGQPPSCSCGGLAPSALCSSACGKVWLLPGAPAGFVKKIQILGCQEQQQFNKLNICRYIWI